MKRLPILAAAALVIAMLASAASSQQRVTRGAPGAGDSPRQNIAGFFEALNAGGDMTEFFAQATTTGFRERRTPAENQALADRLRSDFGELEISGMMRRPDNQVEVPAQAEKGSMTVRFIFHVQGTLIDGLEVEVGGPDPSGAGLLELPQGADQKQLLEAIGRELDKLAKADRFSGVVLLARDGAPVFNQAYGLANREQKVANTPSTRFDVGSITKLMTKVAVAQLLAKGSLRLQDTILDHLPDYPNKDVGAKVRVEHLVDHSSGLGDIFNERWDGADKSTMLAPKDFFPLFADLPLQFEPGEGNAYSNAGYIVLGAIVEAAAKQPYDQYLAQHIFAPAGMTSSGFPIRDGSDPAIAIGYGGEDPSALEPNLGELPIRGCPAGSSSHTALDLLRFEHALRSEKLVNRAWTNWVYSGSKDPDESPAGHSIGVAGGGTGVSAYLEASETFTVVVLANRDPQTTSGLSRQLTRALRASR